MLPGPAEARPWLAGHKSWWTSFLLAQAEGQRANLLAEAEGKQRLAEALNAYQDAAIQLTLSQAFIQGLPQMIEGAARPLGQIDKLTIIDTGGDGNGPLNRLSAVVPANLLAFIESFEAATGIDLKSVWGPATGKQNGPTTPPSATPSSQVDSANKG
ncbi:MAG: hypothetical protein EXR50_04375 [Dehalococcoidia bacterium]|nr:hypothetical protein [Dehalococcoidia bacterium]